MFHKHQYGPATVSHIRNSNIHWARSYFTWVCKVEGCAKVKTLERPGLYELPEAAKDSQS